MKKVIITAAVNGSRQDTPGINVPVSPAEIAEDAYRCHQAGAAVVHVHARDIATRNATADLAVYAEIVQRVRDKGDMLVETTTGIGPKIDPLTGKPALDPVSGNTLFRPDEERLGLLHIDPPQDLLNVTAGSFNYFNEANQRRNTIYTNSSHYLEQNARLLSRRPHQAFQFEVFDVSFLTNIQRLVDNGSLDASRRNFWINYCLGFGGLPATPHYLALIEGEGQRLFPGTRWGVIGAVRQHFQASRVAVEMGADVLRTGFEDVVQLPNGDLAPTNAHLIEALVKIVRTAGREVATPQEARRMLNIGVDAPGRVVHTAAVAA
jgi:3-keto-5-aminohexanoate cleavage enzyme